MTRERERERERERSLKGHATRVHGVERERESAYLTSTDQELRERESNESLL
jgi:hypothetical protein